MYWPSPPGVPHAQSQGTTQICSLCSTLWTVWRRTTYVMASQLKSQDQDPWRILSTPDNNQLFFLDSASAGRKASRIYTQLRSGHCHLLQDYNHRVFGEPNDIFTDVELHHKTWATCSLATHTQLTCHQKIYSGIRWDQFVRLTTSTDLTTDLVVANNRERKWCTLKGDTTFECRLKTGHTRHMLQCKLLTHPCSNDRGKRCAERWKKLVWWRVYPEFGNTYSEYMIQSSVLCDTFLYLLIPLYHFILYRLGKSLKYVQTID